MYSTGSQYGLQNCKSCSVLSLRSSILHDGGKTDCTTKGGEADGMPHIGMACIHQLVSSIILFSFITPGSNLAQLALHANEGPLVPAPHLGKGQQQLHHPASRRSCQFCELLLPQIIACRCINRSCRLPVEVHTSAHSSICVITFGGHSDLSDSMPHLP